MINMLIADDNIYFAKALVNSIMHQNNEVRLLYITTDGEETLDKLLNNSIDLLLLDLKMPKFGGIDIIQKLDILDLPKIPQIIVISAETDLLHQISRDTRVTACINKVKDIDAIATQICNIIHNRVYYYDKYHKEIVSQLTTLGFNFKHNGTQYLIDTILFVLEHNDDTFYINLEKNIYPFLSTKYGKTIHTIKSNILKAIHSMYMECEIGRLTKYFNFVEDIKPTPKMLISEVINKIKHK